MSGGWSAPVAATLMSSQDPFQFWRAAGSESGRESSSWGVEIHPRIRSACWDSWFGAPSWTWVRRVCSVCTCQVLPVLWKSHLTCSYSSTLVFCSCFGSSVASTSSCFLVWLLSAYLLLSTYCSTVTYLVSKEPSPSTLLLLVPAVPLTYSQCCPPCCPGTFQVCTAWCSVFSLFRGSIWVSLVASVNRLVSSSWLFIEFTWSFMLDKA